MKPTFRSLLTASLFGLLIFGNSAAMAEETPYQKKVNAYMKGLPMDVVALLERVQSCDHWAGEEPYNKEREDQIVAAVTKLKCDDIDSDKTKILRKYEKQKAVVKKIRGFPADLN